MGKPRKSRWTIVLTLNFSHENYEAEEVVVRKEEKIFDGIIATQEDIDIMIDKAFSTMRTFKLVFPHNYGLHSYMTAHNHIEDVRIYRNKEKYKYLIKEAERIISE